MVKRVYKYPIKITAKQEISFPKGAEIVSIQVINDEVFIYALVSTTEQEKESKIFIIQSTGQDIPYEGFSYKFIGTFKVADTGALGYFVGHIFEQI